MKSNTGPEFFEKSKYPHLSEADQAKGIAQPPLELPCDASARVIDLPAPDKFDLPDFGLRKAIEQRRSVRSFSRQSLTLNELAYLLWCTQGVQRRITVEDSEGRPVERTFRTVPSAGARHAFETYLCLNNVEGLPNGLYRYLALEHKLVEMRLDDSFGRAVAMACLNQTWMADAAAVFMWVADAKRMTWRYVERGYRYMLLDAGHVCQNLYLCAESIECGACAIAAFDDDAVNELLGLNGVENFAIYLATVGKKIVR